MIISRLIAGLLFLGTGIFFIIFSFFSTWFLIIYGVVLIFLGLFLLITKNEDKIEKRKDLKEKVYKK
jgi:predicted membrane protein